VPDGTVLQFGDLTIDRASRRARRGEREFDLTKTEFDLLELLAENAGVVLERDVIYDRIWGIDFETSSNSLDVYIGYLRRKTEADGEPRLIHTMRGVGYVLRKR
jgi:two-component system response regulator MprA